MNQADLIVIGGGLAGCEAAWQAAEQGIRVDLYEMRPERITGAHSTENLSELICSNSLGSNLADRVGGILLNELRSLNSLLIRIADKNSVPAGGALAVDREKFAKEVTSVISSHPRINVIREEVTEIPNKPCVIATGPLTSPGMIHELENLVGRDAHYFYDAIAPIVEADSIDMKIAFRASRYGRGEGEEGDYINCPLSAAEYDAFVTELINAQRIPHREFEEEIDNGVNGGQNFFFERCLPVEVLAARGPLALAFGPMRPAGLFDPRSGKWPFAVIQLRQDDIANSLYNLVGFQTNLTFKEQKRVLKMVPGLADASYIRFGQMHRNSFICSPLFLTPTGQHRENGQIFFAGQLIGVEGYSGNIASGWIAGINAARSIINEALITLPTGTMIGALMWYICNADPNHFQPMKANFGLLPPLDFPKRITKTDKHTRMAKAARMCLDEYLTQVQL